MHKLHPDIIIFFIYFIYQANPKVSIIEAYNEVRDCQLSSFLFLLSKIMSNSRANSLSTDTLFVAIILELSGTKKWNPSVTGTVFVWRNLVCRLLQASSISL